MGPLLTPLKGRSKDLVREGWSRGRTGWRTVSLSLSLADACNPLLQAHPTWAQDNTEAAGFPFAVSPPFVLRLAPTHLGWDTRRQFTRRSRDPRGRNADRSPIKSPISSPYSNFTLQTVSSTALCSLFYTICWKRS
jgi:hypothetical protein